MNERLKKDELLKDLQLIKEAAKKNNNILKFISLSEGIKKIALLSGILIIAVSLALLWMIESYGSYQEIPSLTKLFFYVLSVLLIIGLIFLKVKVLLKIARKQKKDLGLLTFLKEVYTRSLLMITIPFLIAIIVLCVYLSISHLSYLIVPILAILISLLLAAMSSILNIKEMSYWFAWLFVSGLCSLFIAKSVHPLLLLIFTFGLGMILLYLSSWMYEAKEKRD